MSCPELPFFMPEIPKGYVRLNLFAGWCFPGSGLDTVITKVEIYGVAGETFEICKKESKFIPLKTFTFKHAIDYIP